MPSPAGIDRAHYHGWQGKRNAPWLASLAIARVAVLQIFRRKLYWVAVAMGLMIFLLYFTMIFAAARLDSGATDILAPEEDDQRTAATGAPPRRTGLSNLFFRRVTFSPTAGDERYNGYLRFMERQSLIVIILLGFSGSLVVGADYRQGSLPFYLSRGIDRRHYLLGKWLGIAAVISLMTALPALVLFVEYGMYTSGFDYWITYWWCVPAILGYGLVLCTVLGLIVMALSAYLQRTAPIAITCFSLFSMLWTIGRQLRDVTGNKHWRLIDLWRDMRYVGRYFFDPYCRGEDRQFGPWALAILLAICLLCVAALFRRVRAVEVVQ